MSAAEDEVEAVKEVGKIQRVHSPGVLEERLPIDGQDLTHVGNSIMRQPGLASEERSPALPRVEAAP